MAKKIQIDIMVNGKMEKATISARKLKDALNQSSKAQDDLNASQRRGYRASQGTAQNTANGTKAFSKQAGVVGGLVPIYATFAANVFAVSAAFGVLSRNAAIQQLETSLNTIGISAGKNLPVVADNLRDITGNAISTEAALRATAVATTNNFSTSQLQGLTKVATGASIALGRNLPDALDRLVRGTAKLEPEILDELGIIVRLDDATRTYAASLGKTVGDLTTFERQQAFLNATIEQGLNKYSKIATAVDPNPYDRLASAFEDLTKTTLGFLNKALTPVVEMLSESPTALIGVLGLFSTTMVSQIVPAISDMSAASSARFAQVARAAKISASKIVDNYQVAAKQIQVLDFMPKSFKDIAPRMKAGTASTREMTKAMKSLKISEGRRTAEINKAKVAQQQLSGFQLKASQQFLKAKEAELAAIQAQIVATNRLMDVTAAGATATVVGGGSLGAAQKAANADKRRAVGARIEQQGLSKIENASGVFGAIGALGGGLSLLLGNLGKVEGGTEKVRQGFRSLGSSAKLLGATFSRLLGPLSLVFLAFGIFGPMLAKLFDNQNQLDKETNKIVKTFNNYAKVIHVLRKELIETDNSVVKTYRSLEVAAGLTDQLAGAIGKLQNKADDIALQNLNEKIEEQIELEDRLANLKETGQRGQSARGTTIALTRDIAATQKEIDKLIESLGKMPKSNAVTILTAHIGRLKASGAFKIFPEMEKDLNDLLKKTLTGPDMIDGQSFLEEAEKPTEGFSKLKSAVKSASEELMRFDAERAKLAAKDRSPFSSAIRSAKSFTRELTSVQEQLAEAYTGVADRSHMGTSLEEASALIPGLKAQARFLERKNDLEAGSIQSVEFLQGLQEKYNEELEEAENRLVQQKGILAKQEGILKRINGLTSTGAGFVSNQIAQEKRVVDEKIKGLEAQKFLNQKLLEEEDAKLVNKGIDAEINALQANRNNIVQENYRLEQDKIALFRVELDLIDKQLAAEEKRFEISQKRLQNQSQENNRIRNTNRFSGREEEKAALQERINILSNEISQRERQQEAEIKAAQTKVALEYMLLDAKYQYLEAEANALGAKVVAEASTAKYQDEKERAEAIKKAEDQQKLLSSVAEKYKKIRERTGAASLGFNEEGELTGVQEAGKVIQQIFNNIRNESGADIDALRQKLLDLKQEMMDLDPISEAFDALADGIQDGLGGAIADVMNGTKKAKDAFADLATSVLKSFQKVLVDELTTRFMNFLGEKAEGTGFAKLFKRESADDSGTTPVPGASGTGVAAAGAGAATGGAGGMMGMSSGGVDGMGLGASALNPLYVTMVESPVGALGGGVGGVAEAAGAIGGAVAGAGETGGDPATKATEDNTEATKKLTLNTASMVTGTLATVAALTGNEKAAAALALVTAGLQAVQLGMSLFQKIQAPVEKSLTTAQTSALALNTLAVKANTMAQYASMGGFRSGGISTPAGPAKGYSNGGISRGSQAGYPVTLHGTEAVVPLPNGKSIPVEMSGTGGGMNQNNVAVNVNMHSDGTTESNEDGRDLQNLGKRIATVVQQELQTQKRAGGMLSPYGAA